MNYLKILAAAFLLTAITLPAQATTYTPITDSNLLDQSGIVIDGRVIAVNNNPDATRPATRYTLTVVDVLKGDITREEITVTVPGGPGADGRYLKIDGAPQFSVDDEVLLFLNEDDAGNFVLTQFMLGAFTITERNGVRLALRNLSEVQELPRNGRKSSIEKIRRERKHALFIDWIRNQVSGFPGADTYWYDLPPGTPGPHVFRYQTQGARWDRFDAAAGVDWTAHQSGQQNMSGGGFSEFQAAMAAWTDDAGSNIDYGYIGITTSAKGLVQSDGENSILFNDPNNEISGSYDCSSGGVLALGGWWSQGSHTYKGTTFNTIVEGDIVIQNGAGCYLEKNNGKNGEEVFAHELGHSLGLGHSSDPNALMYHMAHGDGRGAQLQPDDRNAVLYLYADMTTPDTPDAPVITVNQPDARITVSWSKAGGAGSYQLYRTTNPGQTGMEIYSGADLSYTDNAVVRETTYFYRVRACNANGCSSFSDYTQGVVPAADTGRHVLTPVYQLLLFQ